MPATQYGFPYPAATDPVAAGAAAIQALAEAVDDDVRHLIQFGMGAVYGPTVVTNTGNGDALFNFSPFVAAAGAYYLLELFGPTASSGGSSVVNFRLHDGTAPGALIGSEIAYRFAATNPGAPLAIRFPIIGLSAGSHTLQLRWRGTDSQQLTLGASGYGFTALLRRV